MLLYHEPCLPDKFCLFLFSFLNDFLCQMLCCIRAFGSVDFEAFASMAYACRTTLLFSLAITALCSLCAFGGGGV